MERFNQVGIIGMGLIGGSIAKALMEKNISIKTEGDLSSCDLVVIATPLETIIPIAETLKSSLVIDVGSIKGEITARFEELTSAECEFVATHPMAGSEKSGYENSQSDLFKEAPWVITPHKKNTEAALAKVKAFIELLGAQAMTLYAQTHDRRMALISQLPHLISLTLFEFVKQTDPNAIAMSGPGFKSMTRLVKDNPGMRQQMADLNETAFNQCLKEFYDYFTFRHKCN